MCGIVGYIGKNKALPVLVEGLRALEYRGYDSAGVAVFSRKKKKVEVVRRVGEVSELEKAVEDRPFLEASVGIAHTRWATHGSPTEANAHPHFDEKRRVFVVHNGIVENCNELKKSLQKKGYKFSSETDTETIAVLAGSLLDEGFDPKSVFLKTLSSVKGAYGLVFLFESEPDKLFVARLSSSLILGVGEDENFIASDPSALVGKTRRVIYLKDGEIAEVKKDEIKVSTFEDKPVDYKIDTPEFDSKKVSKGDFEHFMLKEIHEGPETILSAIRGRIDSRRGLVKLGGLEDVSNRFDKIDKIIIVACGTSYYAGMVGKYFFETIAGVDARVELACEFDCLETSLDCKTAVIVISQSGETADTLKALRRAKEKGVLTLGVVNVVGSTIANETDAGVYNRAGPEIGVASTKAYISQTVVLLLIALYKSKRLSRVAFRSLLKEIESLPNSAKDLFAESEKIKRLAEKYARYNNFLFIGRHYGYPTALEGALKLKEISYIHAEGYSAGEMKHGPIALIDENFPTLAICLDNDRFSKTLSNIQEIKARKGQVLALASLGNEEVEQIADDVLYIPSVSEPLEPILSVIPLQLFAYYAGVARGINVDRPRNLAKSVTVE